jgi:hypothetical protein
MCGGFTLNADTDVCENVGCHGSKVGPSATVSGGIGNKAPTAEPDKGREEDQESPYKYFLRSLEGGGDPDRQTGTPAESPAKSIAHRDARRTPMSWLRKLFERPSGTMPAKVDASQMPVATAGTRLRRDEATPAVEQAPEQPTYTLPQALVYMEEIGKQMGFLRPAQTHYQIAVADLMRRQPLYIRDRSLSIPLVVVEICGAPESLNSFLRKNRLHLHGTLGYGR